MPQPKQEKLLASYSELGGVPAVSSPALLRASARGAMLQAAPAVLLGQILSGKHQQHCCLTAAGQVLLADFVQALLRDRCFFLQAGHVLVVSELPRTCSDLAEALSTRVPVPAVWQDTVLRGLSAVLQKEARPSNPASSDKLSAAVLIPSLK